MRVGDVFDTIVGALGRLTPSEYATRGQMPRSEAARLHSTLV